MPLRVHPKVVRGRSRSWRSREWWVRRLRGYASPHGKPADHLGAVGWMELLVRFDVDALSRCISLTASA
jgi:hypothetical protein